TLSRLRTILGASRDFTMLRHCTWQPAGLPMRNPWSSRRGRQWLAPESRTASWSEYFALCCATLSDLSWATSYPTATESLPIRRHLDRLENFSLYTGALRRCEG